MEYVRFGELYDIPSSNGVSRPSAVRGKGFHMINMGELFSYNIINEVPMDRVLLSDKEQKKFFVNKEDLLFARQSLVASGAGKCSIVNNIEEQTTFESHLIRVRLNKKCNPWYYFYLFQLPYNPVKTIVNQCAQAGIRGTELVKIKVPFPPKSQQDKIASILSTYDTLIENNTKRIRLLEQMAENLYKEWFVRFRFPGHENVEMENGLPKGWKVEKLDDLLINGFNGGWGEENFSEKAPIKAFVIRGTDINDVKNGKFEDIPLRFHKNVDLEKKQLLQGDIILELSNGNIDNIGRTLYVNDDLINTLVHVMSASFCKTLRMKDKKISFLIYRHLVYMQKSGLLNYYKNSGTNGINNFNYKRFLRHEFVLPNDCLLIDKLLTIQEEIYKIVHQSTLLTRQRDLLLPRLMSGKLEVKA